MGNVFILIVSILSLDENDHFEDFFIISCAVSKFGYKVKFIPFNLVQFTKQ